MTRRFFRFRRFGVRVGVLLFSLVIAVLAIIYVRVSGFNERQARAHAAANLDVAERIFTEATNQRIENLAATAGVMSSDPEIRDALRDPTMRRALSAELAHHASHVGASVIALFDLEKTLIANSQPDMPNENEGPFQYLIELASRESMARASDYSYLDGKLHVLVVVPLYAPHPKIIGWYGLAFPLDEAFARRIKAISQVDVTFVSTEKAGMPRVLATTLPPSGAAVVARAAAQHGDVHAGADVLALPDDRYLTLFRRQELLGEDPIAVVLQRPLSADLADARQLESYLVRTSVIALMVAGGIAWWIARDLTRPVQALAQHTRHVAAGDYARRVQLDRVDELGQLATAFNEMSAGLAERDRVRDLLDKNVSPEIAAQLLRDGAALGGEEREVTILFADLRGFTTMSEQLAPCELLHLLNRYLDRMSGEIERHGGIIDKFIGDAIMALFGAPVAQGDAPDRALAAALAMETALGTLNQELAAEGKPPLAIGVGINTARVVAGNIGSHRRLNYSVIGDGVNVAARLQAETRKKEFATNIITSAATVTALRHAARSSLRPLGDVKVKGRSEAVKIFAVDQPA